MNTIKVNPKAFVWGDIEDFEEVETVKDYETLYKDYCSATTICKQISTGKFYALDWNSYESHYGFGEDTFHSDEAYEVQQVEKVTVEKIWKAV